MDTYSLCLNSDHFAEGYSVTRLGVFESYWCQNFLEQVASIFGNILGYLEKYNFKSKNCWGYFWSLLGYYLLYFLSTLEGFNNRMMSERMELEKKLFDVKSRFKTNQELLLSKSIFILMAKCFQRKKCFIRLMILNVVIYSFSALDKCNRWQFVDFDSRWNLSRPFHKSFKLFNFSFRIIQYWSSTVPMPVWLKHLI